MFDILNENAPTKIEVKDFDEAKKIIAELQQEIKKELKENVDKKHIQPELRSRVKEFIDIDKWEPQIDYIFHSCTKEQIVSPKIKTLAENQRILAKNQKTQAENQETQACCLNDLIETLKKMKFRHEESNKNIENLHKRTENSHKRTEEAYNQILESLNDIDECEEDKTVTEYYLEIKDAKESIERKIDDWTEKLISSAQYPYLRGGTGLRKIVGELAIVLYDHGHELDNEIIKKIHHILQRNFNYKEVECIGDYALRDYFIEEIKDDIDENITTRKAMILEDKYAENPLIIKGHVIIPDNSVSHEERKFEPDEQCVDSQSQDYL